MNALGYSEFSSRIPAAGSAYSYTYNTMGEFAAFLMGWVLLLEYGISAAATARGFAAYIGSLLSFAGVPCPPWMIQMPVLQWLGPYFSISLIAPLTVITCAVIMTAGVEESSRFNRWVTGINVTLIVFFWAVGWFFIDWDRFTPMAPFGTEGVLEGAGVLFFCFIGFDSVSTLSEEVKRPQRDIPLGIIGTLLCVTVLYVGTSVVLIGMVPLDKLDDSAPLAGAFLFHKFKTLYVLVSLGAASTTFCTTFTCIMAQPRIFYRMSLDGLWFASFHEIQPDSLLPIKGIWMTTVIVAITAGVVNFDVLIRLISAGTLLSYTVVCVGVLIVRYTHQQHHTNKHHRPYCNQEEQHPTASISPSYSPPSLFSLDADDESEMFFSEDDGPAEIPADSAAQTSSPTTRLSQLAEEQEETTGAKDSPHVTTSPPLASRSKQTLCAVTNTATPAAAKRSRSRSRATREAEALVGPVSGSVLSTSLLMTGPCGLEDEASGVCRDIPLTLPVVMESSRGGVGQPREEVRGSALPWDSGGGLSPADSCIALSPYKAQSILFGATVHTLPWMFALITLLLGFALQSSAPSFVTWTLAGLSGIITLVFLLLHSFHELALREYFVHQLEVYRHNRRSRSSSSAALSESLSAAAYSPTLSGNHRHLLPAQQLSTFVEPPAPPCFITGSLRNLHDDRRSGATTADAKSAAPSDAAVVSTPGGRSSATVTPGRSADPFHRIGLHRTDHFRCPGVPLVPLAGIFLNSYLMASLQLVTLVHTLVYLSVGALIYIFYGAWHSTLHSSMYFASPVVDPLLPAVVDNDNSMGSEDMAATPQQAAGRNVGN
eukprot:GHVS01037982.1.p1 GENE.GHVS01037982.1~~GHVS01037982.1.p1  ORF type:complete len:892 (-),score=115.14 GHVS01037982.1:155-2635(-)